MCCVYMSVSVEYVGVSTYNHTTQCYCSHIKKEPSVIPTRRQVPDPDFLQRLLQYLTHILFWLLEKILIFKKSPSQQTLCGYHRLLQHMCHCNCCTTVLWRVYAMLSAVCCSVQSCQALFSLGRLIDLRRWLFIGISSWRFGDDKDLQCVSDLCIAMPLCVECIPNDCHVLILCKTFTMLYCMSRKVCSSC